MPNKPEDTQQLDTAAIKEAGINYRPRKQQQQPKNPANAVMITFMVCTTIMVIAAVISATILLYH